jgi:hypothetical protein
MAAVARITCNEMSSRLTSEAIQLHGGFGFTHEFAIDLDQQSCVEIGTNRRGLRGPTIRTRPGTFLTCVANAGMFGFCPEVGNEQAPIC